MLRNWFLVRSGAVTRLAIVLWIALAVMGMTTMAYAGSDGRRGTAGASELLIPVGPRGSALGGTIVADVLGIESMYWNPAGLGGSAGTEVLVTHTQYFADMKLNYAGITTKAGGFGTLGLSVKILSVGDVIVTTEQAPDGTGEILHPTFSTIGMAWGRSFTDRVNFGAIANWVHEDVANNIADGLAFDFGVQYDADWRGLRLGMVLRNMGTSMEFSGPGFETSGRDPNADPNAGPRTVSFSSDAFEMPSHLVLSASSALMSSNQQKLLALAAFQSNNFSGDQIRGGLEWGYREMATVRASYFGTFTGTIDPSSGEETVAFEGGDDLQEGLALGAGFKTRFGDAGKMGVDLCWRPARTQFDDIIEFGLSLSF